MIVKHIALLFACCQFMFRTGRGQGMILMYERRLFLRNNYKKGAKISFVSDFIYFLDEIIISFRVQSYGLYV
jgi:hypothetical protein